MMIMIKLEGRPIEAPNGNLTVSYIAFSLAVIVSGVKALLIFVSTDVRVRHCHPKSGSD